MKILIIDDNKKILETLQKILVNNGHDISCSDNPEEAIDILKEGGFDFILLDYKMPGKDGIWFMENAEIPNTTKVLLITAFVDREIINKMFGLGASGYLIKPFTSDDVLRHLEFFSK